MARSRRPPRTSYGYLAPPEARVGGWRCFNEDCHAGGEPAPRWWPFLCTECHRPADPVFEEPWAHEAEEHLIRHDLTNADWHQRTAAELKVHIWSYKDAWFRGDGAAARAAWHGFRRTRQRQQQRGEDWWVTTATGQMVLLAALADDIDGAVPELRAWHPRVDTRDLEDDNTRRTDARVFVSACSGLLEREASIGHPHEAEIDHLMRDIAARAEDVLTPAHQEGFRRIRLVRTLPATTAAIEGTRRAPGPVGDRLPPISVVAGADSALDAAELHDDHDALDALIRRLAADGGTPSLLHLLRARRLVLGGALRQAMDELALAAEATDELCMDLRPVVYATHGRVRTLHDPAALDAGIADCRTGRHLGLRRWRGTTAADTELARLLLWRGSDRSDVGEAVRLARRRCRPWRYPGVEDRIVLQEALSAYDTLTGHGNTERRRRAWRDAVASAGSVVERARFATAWVGWAVGTGDPELAAEAYQHLVALIPLDAAARTGSRARERVLAAAQEHIEDAGYWLARSRRYREAVVALETGRAIALTGTFGGEQFAAVDYPAVTAATGDGALLYVAAAKAGGYALVVAARHDPQFVELPKLDRATVAALVGTTRSGQAVRGTAATRDADPVTAAADPLAEVLRALWDGGMRDLLLDKARGSVVTLVPVGLLSLLPLHAAGGPLHAAGDPDTPGHAGRFSAIRYAPNARGLRRCQDLARELDRRPLRLLAVDAPASPGGTPLRYVAHETDAVARRWSSPGTRVTHDCTWAEFRDSADGYTVWHLACHGVAEPHAILDTRLCFTDRDVTLGELRRILPTGRRRLAVLSACETNLTEVTAPNEVVGLPSALLQVGFAGVVASAWKVDDLATAYLMTAFYHLWCGERHPPAVALNLAQRWLRHATRAELTAALPGTDPGGFDDQPFRDPRYWAAFAYTGA
ncbi:CHAT domain-containing protein [Dactylosporangium sp. NPDC005555]|uniref:CHAT domain-containing protein n=1 Tax=Dactylosporangium sp. NPDC005555 TaxID=3154889 RepID=UPI0033BD39AD